MRKNCRFILLTTILVFGLTASAHAKIFEYVDENGQKHYTDRKDKIPEKYRKDKGNVNVFTSTMSETPQQKAHSRKVVKQNIAQAAQTATTTASSSKLIKNKSIKKTVTGETKSSKPKKRAFSSFESASPYKSKSDIYSADNKTYRAQPKGSGKR